MVPLNLSTLFETLFFDHLFNVYYNTMLVHETSSVYCILGRLQNKSQNMTHWPVQKQTHKTAQNTQNTKTQQTFRKKN